MRAAAGRLAVLSLQYSIASARAAPQRLNPQGIGTRLMATKFSEITAAEMRSAMIDSKLRTNDVIDPAVIGAMAAVPREDRKSDARGTSVSVRVDLGGSR